METLRSINRKLAGGGRHAVILTPIAVGLLLAQIAAAQTFGATGSTQLSVTVGPEAAISVVNSTTLVTTGTTFTNPFTGTTTFTYKVRTSKASGGGNITVKVTSDFTGSGLSGPSVANGDALTYSCSVGSSGTPCSSQSASTTSATPVATFGANAHSTLAGDSGSVAWSLANDPKYETGTYNATVTFTISAT